MKVRYVEMVKGLGREATYIYAYLTKNEIMWYKKEGFKLINDLSKNGIRIEN